ncbi:SRPBCC family protein [Leifsonia flava]|uniref:SRPBCC family protein n=1 Tax=Orlajensenia leifsoniae TaxID=2561933 RepID=UPI0014306FDB|nr:SRPBCC family protein [Leifsonia flava]
MKFENVVTITRQPAEVFEYLARFENVPRWNYAISETRKLTRGPVGVGTRYRQTRTVPSPTTEEFEVVEIETDRRLVVVGDLASLHGRVTYELSGGDGMTKLANLMDLTAPPPLGLLAHLATRSIRSSVAANLSVLKDQLERSSR